MIKAIGGKKARVKFEDLLLRWSGGEDSDQRRSLGRRLPESDEDDDD